MSNKLLLSIAAGVVGLPGLFLLFAPDLALGCVGITHEPGAQLFTQLAGGLAVAFGINNWMARGALIGGIYGRPLLMANLSAFFCTGLALVKAHSGMPGYAAVITVGGVFLLCGLGFGRLLFKQPGE